MNPLKTGIIIGIVVLLVINRNAIISKLKK